MSRKLSLAAKIALIALLVGGAGTGGYAVYANVVHSDIDVPDFVGKDVRIVDVYAKRDGYANQIAYSYEFSEEYKENIIIAQSTTSLDTKDTLELVVSKGFDPDKLFKMPDFKEQMKDEIETWFTENHFSNVTFEYTAVEDESIEDDTFVSSNPEAGNDVKRSDDIVITLVSHDIKAPNLVGMSREDIDAWAKKWKVTVNYEELDSNLHADGDILGASINEGDVLHRGDSVTVTIARHSDSPTEEPTEEEIRNRYTDSNADAPARDSGYTAPSEQPANPAPQDTPAQPEEPVTPEEPVVTNACPSSIGPASLYDGYNVSQILGRIPAQGCSINVIYADNPNSLQGVQSYISYGNSADLYVYAVE